MSSGGNIPSMHSIRLFSLLSICITKLSTRLDALVEKQLDCWGQRAADNE